MLFNISTYGTHKFMLQIPVQNLTSSYQEKTFLKIGFLTLIVLYFSIHFILINLPFFSWDLIKKKTNLLILQRINNHLTKEMFLKGVFLIILQYYLILMVTKLIILYCVLFFLKIINNKDSIKLSKASMIISKIFSFLFFVNILVLIYLIYHPKSWIEMKKKCKLYSYDTM